MFAWVAPAKAELPPDVYAHYQAEAPEVLQIRVEQVSSKPIGLFDWSKRIESVQATVLKVTRSKSGVKKGDRISIRYERLIPKGGWAGPSPAPQLEKGKEYPAYLEKSPDGTFGLGARGKSFSSLK
ncbi:hypothetical protein ACFQ5Q_20800 [Luteolibacter ambystomatis]